MSFAADLVAYLDTNSTKVTAGTSLFTNMVSESTGRAVFVVSYGGLPPVDRFSGTYPAMTRPRVQVVVRSTKPAGGDGIGSSTGTENLAFDMWDLCHVANGTLNSNTYQRVVPLQDPFYLERDEAGRAIFVFNAEALRSATTQG